MFDVMRTGNDQTKETKGMKQGGKSNKMVREVRVPKESGIWPVSELLDKWLLFSLVNRSKREEQC